MARATQKEEVAAHLTEGAAVLHTAVAVLHTVAAVLHTVAAVLHTVAEVVLPAAEVHLHTSAVAEEEHPIPEAALRVRVEVGPRTLAGAVAARHGSAVLRPREAAERPARVAVVRSFAGVRVLRSPEADRRDWVAAHRPSADLRHGQASAHRRAAAHPRPRAARAESGRSLRGIRSNAAAVRAPLGNRESPAA